MIARYQSILLAVALSVAASPALAHGGHAPVGGSGHSLVHFLPWIMAACLLSASVVVLRGNTWPV